MTSNIIAEPMQRDGQADDPDSVSEAGQRHILAQAARARGRALLLLSSVAFAIMGLSVRLVPEPITSHEKVFYRSLIGTVILLVWFGASREPIDRPRNLVGLLCRGLFGATSLLCFFYSIDHIGLAKATLYCYMYPIYAAVFAWWDLGERPSSAALLALLMAVIGAAMTLDSHGLTFTFTRGDAAGLMAGLMSGAAVTSIRRLTRTERSAWIVLSFTVASTLMAIPFMRGGHATATVPIIISLLAVGVSAIAAQILLTKGLKYITAVEGGVLSLMAVPLSAILSLFALHEVLRIRFWLGAALIMAAAITLIMMPGRSAVPPPNPDV
ncbi:MAG: DMT family transporter [Candidatus Sumerlaeaceae bacterium]